MPSLLSGSQLNSSSPSGYSNITSSQYLLGPTPTTSTGYTLIANSASQVTYVSSLGNIDFDHGKMTSNLPDQNIQVAGTGTGTVIVSGSVLNTSTNTGVLVVEGGIGIWDGFYTGKDVHINKLTVGQGWEGFNNVIIRGDAVPPANDDFTGHELVAIGYDTLMGMSTSKKSIGIGRFAISSGTQLSNTIAIGDSALKNLGIKHTLFVATITNITQSYPGRVTTLAPHGLSSGTQVTIDGVNGMENINNEIVYVDVTGPTTLNLYTDINLNVPVDTDAYSPYTSGGEVLLDLVWDDNIAVGTNAGVSLFNGRQNFFLGDNIAVNLTTGSYNILIGHEVANNMTNGNANISLGGDNLVDGRDNQVNIGSVFYYDGGGYTQINSDLGVGIGTWADSTNTGALVVDGGVGVIGNMVVGGLITGTITTALNLSLGDLGSIPYQTAPGQTDFIPIGAVGTVLVSNGTTATWAEAAALSAQTSTNAENMFIHPVIPLQTYYIALAEGIDDYFPEDADVNLTYVTTASTTGSYFVPGTHVLNVPGSVYTIDGNPDESNLLHTPRVTISTTAPSNPRIGDFWIDPTYGVELQYVNDNGNKFWIQFTGI